jgi:hypothetical protein
MYGRKERKEGTAGGWKGGRTDGRKKGRKDGKTDGTRERKVKNLEDVEGVEVFEFMVVLQKKVYLRF